MGFAILATFPLGAYRARRDDGTTDFLPSPARLHAALVAAAAQGSAALSDGHVLQLALPSRAALEWLEDHPPDGLIIPPIVTDGSPTVAFRPEGFFGKRPKGRRVLAKNLRKDALRCVAIGGAVGWTWDEEPPAEIHGVIEQLCADTPYLGTVDSPVILSVGDATATHRREPAADFLSATTIEVDVVTAGRLAALEEDHRRAIRPVGGARNDKVREAEEATVRPVVRIGLRRAAYVAETAPAPTVPWPTVVLLPVDRYVREESRVRACVALHRALVAIIGDGAPALVTGRPTQSRPRPANHLAIQYVPASLPLARRLDAPGAFALLVPPSAAEELAVIDRAITSLKRIRMGAAGVAHVVGSPIAVPGDSFWSPVRDGHERLWAVVPAAIPESRPLAGGPWTIGDAALLSVAMVLRERCPREEGRSRWYRSLVDAITGAGAAVVEAHKLHTSDVSRYVHRIRSEMAVQPYRAILRLGPLAGSGTILAIGQSRHLGGGLLVPVDVPAGSGCPAAGGEERP